MTIGLLTIEVSIDGAFSLKEKRMVVNRIRDRVRQKFNVAVAEIDEHQVWNRAVLGVVTLSTEQTHTNRVLSKVADFVGTLRDCVVEDFAMEFL